MGKKYLITLQSILSHPIWELLVFTLLTFLSVLNGKTTVFYVIYLFWWNELIRIIIDRLFYRINKSIPHQALATSPLFTVLIQMGIYVLFIIVFFGIMANWKNQDLTLVNLEVLVFKNWFFNANLLLIAIGRIFTHTSNKATDVSLGIFTPNMLVLHVSIVIGGVLMVFVVKNFPDIFTPENLWGSVIIILPFLMLKTLLQYLLNKEEKALNPQA